MNDWPYAHGGPPLCGRLRTRAEDFVVEEELGFSASGDGEHVLLSVRKRGTNTDWLAGRLADFAGVRRPAVAYAGLKDRHAVTTQSFSVHLPGQEAPDWSAFPEPEVEILTAERHHRKLRRGALAGNRFTIVLRELSGDQARALALLDTIAALGVPNYFGEQRFGHGGRNIERAEAMFAGARVNRKQRGMLISAARSFLFNTVLAERVTSGTWNRAIAGEVCCLNGSHSWFLAQDDDADLAQRIDTADVHPSGPMWGRGELPTRAEAAALEQAVADRLPKIAKGLAAERLDQDRRPLRLFPQNLLWQWLDDTSLQLSFGLDAGSYATTVLRELATWPNEPPARGNEE